MPNILLYGNCQMEALAALIKFSPNYCIFIIECWKTEISVIEFTNLIQNMDIIIMHGIEDNYRNKPYLSNTYIINNCKPTTNIMLLTTLYFPYYYFDCYIGDRPESELLYEYKAIKQYKIDKKSTNEILEKVIYNKDFKTKQDLIDLEDYCFNELHKRYENMKLYVDFYKNRSIKIINIIPFIKQNFKHELLFYSMNHPTLHLLKYTINEINKEINKEIDCVLDLNSDIDFFSYYKGVIYSCLQKQLTFDISTCPIKINDCTSITEFIDFY